jgi:hypothetical protein
MNRLVNQGFHALQADTLSRNKMLIQFESVLNELQHRNEYIVNILANQEQNAQQTPVKA